MCQIRAGRGCMRVGGTVRNTLKEAGAEGGRGHKDFKKGEQAGSRVEALKRGAETPLQTMGIKPRPNIFDEQRLFMNSSTNLGVTLILCSFRQVLEGKAGNAMPESSQLESLETFSTINFFFNRCKQKTTLQSY